MSAKSGGGNQRRSLTMVLAAVAIVCAVAVIAYEVYNTQPHVRASVVVNTPGQAPKLQAMKEIEKGNTAAKYGGSAQSDNPAPKGGTDPMSYGDK